MAVILVCPLSRVEAMVARRKPARVISLLDPDFTFPDLGPDYRGRHLELRFHDVHVPRAGEIAPSIEHIDRLLAFIEDVRPDDDLLVHCRAGIGRSTAAAFIAACVLDPHVRERDLAQALRRASPLARPNQVLVGLADTALRRDGRMIDAIASTGVHLPPLAVSESVPFELPRASG